MKRNALFVFLLIALAVLCACTTPTEIDEATVIKLHDSIPIDVYMRYIENWDGRLTYLELQNLLDKVIQEYEIAEQYPLFADFRNNEKDILD